MFVATWGASCTGALHLKQQTKTVIISNSDIFYTTPFEIAPQTSTIDLGTKRLEQNNFNIFTSCSKFP